MESLSSSLVGFGSHLYNYCVTKKIQIYKITYSCCDQVSSVANF